MAQPVWIVVLNYNGWDDTQKCLASLACVYSDSCAVVVVDNASTLDPTPLVRDQFPWSKCVRNSINGGWAGGNNVGIRFALERGAELVLLLNNDTTVAPQIVDRLRRAEVASPQFGVLGPIINSMSHPEEVLTDGCMFNDAAAEGMFRRKVVPLEIRDPPTVVEVDIVNGCAMMVRRQVFERIGLIDEDFFIVHEESDFCLRPRRAGFRCGVVGESLVWHKHSSAFAQAGKRWQRYYDARNLARLLRKHAHDHHRGRNRWRSWREYFKHAYYYYCHEREAGMTDSANAVIEGLHDGLLGHIGPYADRRRPLAPIIRFLFERVRPKAAPVVADV